MLRAALFMPLVLFGMMAAAWLGGGGGGYGGSPEYYPVTVRMWLNDSFVGGIEPAITTGIQETAVLEMLAAGNDLIYVGPEAPRCPVMTVAWVSPERGTPMDAQVYSATIRCAASPAVQPNGTQQADVQNGSAYEFGDEMTLEELRRAWESP